jgi:hypothetical protein
MSEYVDNYIRTKRYTKMEFPLGAKAQEGQRVYKFVKYNSGDGDDDGVAGGHCLHLEDGYGAGEVTCDQDSATIDVIENKSGGFLQAALEDGEYGWSQVWGPIKIAPTMAGTAAVNGKLYPNTAVVGGITTTDPGFDAVAIARKAGTSLGIDELFVTIEAP